MSRVTIAISMIADIDDIKGELNTLGLRLFSIMFIKILFLAHRIRIFQILPCDRKSFLSTNAILPRTSSNVIMSNCILAYSGILEASFENK